MENLFRLSIRRALFLMALLFALAVASLAPCRAQSPSGDASAKRWVEQPAAKVAGQPRFALVVGNTHYGGSNELKNPENDARAVANTLKQLGFATTVILDASRDQMRDEVHQFCDAVRAAGPQSVALLYYSGHGMQVGGENYLIPIGFHTPSRADDMGDYALSAQKVLDEIQGANAQVSIAILDACRSNPFSTTKAFGEGRGLAKQEAAGLYIAFATAAGSTAEDNPTEKNGRYTTELLRYMAMPGLSIDQVFKKTRAAVYASSNHAQFPYVYDGLLNSDNFSLSGAGATPITITDKMAHVTVSVNAPNAKVTIDGKPVPPGVDTDIDLGGAASKTVEVVAVAEGYHQITSPVTLQPGQEAPIDLTLKKIEQAIHSDGGNGMGKTRFNPKDGAEMIYIPPGPFLMGDEDQSDNPRHTVTLSGYWIYKNLVTVAMYRKFCQVTGRQMPDPPDWGWKDDHPIVNVTWEDAKAYCDWAGVSLPTEAQWEKAARGTDGRKYPWGTDFDTSKLWCSAKMFGDAESTHGVGGFPSGASPYGVLDMAGNVWQWCADWYDRDYLGSRRAQDANPSNNAVGEQRVVRGGSWDYNASDFFRVTNRYGYAPSYLYPNLGFRCCSGSGPG